MRQIARHAVLITKKILFVGCLCNLPPAIAQEPPAASATVVTKAHAIDASYHEDFLQDLHRRQRTFGIMVASSLSVALYGNRKWWQDGFTTDFKARNEGWFGQTTYSGGADKLGHFFMNYTGARLLKQVFQWAGNDAEKSLEYAVWLTLGTFTAVEVLDGFSKQWSFSREDMLMNIAGVGMGIAMERFPHLDSVVDLRFMYRPSNEDGSGFSPFGDYSGQTYLLVLKGSGIPAWRHHGVLRYLELAVGYGTRGYSNSSISTSNPDQRERNLYVGISLNLSELLNGSVFKNAAEGSRPRHLTNTFLEYVQVPGTAALAKHRFPPD